jgi:predicted nucleic acid-binding Zn ribbon protein
MANVTVALRANKKQLEILQAAIEVYQRHFDDEVGDVAPEASALHARVKELIERVERKQVKHDKAEKTA